MGTAKGSIPWNAGTSVGWTDKRGYRWVYISENGKRQARRLHRVVVGLHLGRTLEPWELVHHKDGNSSNNEITNLEITNWSEHTKSHHRGTRRDGDARRSMEAFALMREQLKREREIKAELLAALENAWARMDRARSLLVTETSPWKMLDTSLDRDALAKVSS